MKTLDELNKLTYAVQHNPNCSDPFLVRLVGCAFMLDLLPYHETKDVLGFGKTLIEAARNAMKLRSELERKNIQLLRVRIRTDQRAWEERSRLYKRSVGGPT